jgi:hypothetical protein
VTISQHTLVARMYGTPTSFLLNVKSARITVDETYSPYIMAELVCFAPSAGIVEDIDPRDNLRVDLTMRQEWDTWNGGTRAPESQLFTLMLRSRSVDYTAGTMTLTLSSNEGYLFDKALVSQNPETSGVLSIRQNVNYALAKIGAGLAAGSADAQLVDLDAALWQPGQTLWDWLSPMIQKGGLSLWCDGSRVWHLDASRDRPGLVSVSPENGVKAISDTISRDSGDYYQSVVIKYSWEDSTGTQRVGYDDAGTGMPTLFLDYQQPYPGDGAATHVLKRAQGKGRTLEVEAVSSYKAQPGMTISISLAGLVTQTGVISSVTWSFPDDTMTIKSRGLTDTPAGAYALAPVTRTYANTPASYTYANYEN